MTHCRRHWRAVAGYVMGAILLLTVLTVSPATAQSTTDLRLERARVSVWPEYDDPRVLILYEGAFVDDGGFPHTVEFPVPMGIDVNQAAGLTPDGRYLRQPYQIIPQDGYALLRYENCPSLLFSSSTITTPSRARWTRPLTGGCAAAIPSPTCRLTYNSR